MPSNTEAAEDSSAAVDTPEEPSHGRLEYETKRETEGGVSGDEAVRRGGGDEAQRLFDVSWEVKRSLKLWRDFTRKKKKNLN